jgi:hypothetical protein
MNQPALTIFRFRVGWLWHRSLSRRSQNGRVIEQRLDFESDSADISPTHAWDWIEIDPQFVGVIKIAGPHRMRV